VALYDLDGTLTRHDTLRQYLTGYLHEHPHRWRRVPAALPSLLRYVLGTHDRGALKARWIAAILGGCTRPQIAAWTARFVPTLLDHGLLPEARASLECHRAAGDHLVLLSASPDLYVPAIGEALGFAETLCTGIEWVDGQLTGRLSTPNRRGVEKARCLTALRERYPQLPVVAYGNASSDLPHLVLADRGVLVNGDRRARHQASLLGVATEEWR
jgi:phosphatidylglycerophosphatase C